MHVLYVEDNPDDVVLTSRALARLGHGYALDVASTLAQAREKLNNPSRYQLALLDLHLPDGDGLELLRFIRDRRLPLAVIILTGSGDQDAVIAALKAGADDYLSKGGDYLIRLGHTMNAALKRFHETRDRKRYGLNVLYIEPNKADVEMTLRHLSSHAPHIRMTMAENPMQILEQLPVTAADPPVFDVVLLDYRLPGIDALELTKILRNERNLDIPIVLVTGHGNESIAVRALNLGIDDYVAKHDGYLYELVAVLEKVRHQYELGKEREKLRETTERLSLLLTASPVILYTLTVDAVCPQITWISENIVGDFGYTVQEALQPGWWLEHVHPDDRAASLTKMAELFTENQVIHEYRFIHKNGNTVWVRNEMKLLLDEKQRAFEVIGAWYDITERKQAEESLRRSAAVFESMQDGVVITDLSSTIVAVNPAFCEITGYGRDEVLGRDVKILKSGQHDESFFRALWSSLLATGQWQGEIWNRRKNGELYPQWLTISAIKNEFDQLSHYAGVFTDISQLKQSQERLEHLAHYDPLTNLPNRALIQSRLKHALELAQRHGTRIAVLFIDLDHFKTVNDSLGHPVGDELLTIVARRLKSRLREEDCLGRLGGDEFLVVLEQMDDPQDAVEVALALIRRLQQPFTLSTGQDVVIGASIGISLFPDDAQSVTQLIQHADSAMYLAKNQGRNTYRFYTEDLTRLANDRLTLEIRLRRALDQNEFVLHYQPLISGVSQTVVGMEALLRWQDPELGMVLPGHFIPLAEETGLIMPIAEWVLLTACRQAKSWLDERTVPVYVAVNLSPVQFRGQDIVCLVQSVLDKTGLPARYLELEITESILMEQAEQALITLFNLKTLGVSLAVDDFGTGYSSLAYLKQLPLDKLKIDRSFVDGLGWDANDQAIVKAIIAMGQSLGIKTLAEGVETRQQFETLQKLGCQFYQGYFFSKPVPPEQLAI
ncbi:MAG: EAL domain-containing protein [Gammaproteobacteria bacterium]